ncbi:MAG TPA: catalase family protein [Allosphingosinicella sp.]|nr:catalase family protein [Allosphingosinicella sp.]
MASSGPNSDLEKVPPEESGQIDESADLMVKLLNRRYGGAPRVLRGVHPKDHGCVEATFTVSESLPPELRVGVFRKPGDVFRAAIRFSNAAPLVTPDSPLEPAPPAGKLAPAHGSRGMAIKLYNVSGARLVPEDRERTQDFLMINQPVFAFANVEDYLALNRIIVDDDAAAPKFFARPDLSPEAQKRALTTRGIVARIKGFLPPPFQAPPLSPLDNTYFSAAPFSFGEGRVMKFACKPVNPKTGELGEAVNDPDYLRNAMRQRMAEAGGNDICFDFQVQVRDAASLAGKIETDIEDACVAWNEPFVTVARIAIPPQDITSPQRQEFCETLFYTPWHGLVDHRPLGGINRLRLKVYDVSAQRRGCPVSPDLPPPGETQRGPDPRVGGEPRRGTRSSGGQRR